MTIYLQNPEFVKGILTAIAIFIGITVTVSVGTIISTKFRNFIKRGMR